MIEMKALSQIKAHEDAVNDVSFGNDPNCFVTASADSTCKLFDLREVYTNQLVHDHKRGPLFRVSYDPHDGIYIAIVPTNGNDILVYDHRKTDNLLISLSNHTDLVTQIGWHPHKRYHLYSSSDDCSIYEWVLHSGEKN